MRWFWLKVFLVLIVSVLGVYSVCAAESNIHLYILDIHTGEVTQATPPMDYELYNASFSNNGKKLVHDLVPDNVLGITDLKTGEMTNLGLTGENAVWSPNGQYIAYGNWFDYEASGWDPNVPVVLNVIPADSVTPVTVRQWATDPSWSNNSRRIAFTDWNEGYIGTVRVDGTGETRFDFDHLGTIDGYGCNPDYSPDGNLIVYQRWECFLGIPSPLMGIPVNKKGEPTGAPYQITSGLYYAVQPSVSNDGKTIVFSGNASDPSQTDDFGLYTVPVEGGDPTVLLDRPGLGDWDPAYSKNGRHIVFSGPEGEPEEPE